MKKQSPSTGLAQRLNHFRQAKKLSQKEVAQHLGISPSTYREWELGTAIRGEPYDKLSELFGVSLSQLMYGKTDQKDEVIEELELIKNALNRLISKVISMD